jgi:Tfp pilus assembly protein PilV
MNLTKSKQRVADHGEVFTPAWMVEAMLDLVKDESARIDARFLEPGLWQRQLPRASATPQAWPLSSKNTAHPRSNARTTPCWD